MNIYTGHQHDIWHGINSPGGYEWQYFDAESDCGEWAFTVIFFDGIPMSPYYLEDYLDGSNPLPEHHRGYVISIYHHHVRVAYSFHYVANSGTLIMDDKSSIQIGDSIVQFDGTSWLLTLDTRKRSGTSTVLCSLQFTPNQSLNHCNDELNWSESHIWIAAAPMCHVHGSIEIFESDIPVASITFHGKGYHDHNAGLRPLHKDLGAWYWGRCILENGDAVIFYQTSGRTATQQTIQSVLVCKEHSVHHEQYISFSEQGIYPNLFFLPIAKELTWSMKDINGDESELCVTIGEALERSPFYYRCTAEATYTIHGKSQRATCIMEYYHPQRLLHPIVRAMVRTPFAIFPNG
ncbi:MAG: hypothetical protein JNL32_13345 [Candidatus Kapabacteria bacterium]|nr:hypothetical protein [Candidatus Kapabacteria bacterium]